MSLLAAISRARVVVRSEGWRSLRERYADRARDRERRRSFQEHPLSRLDVQTPILNLLPFPLRRIWGGTALQLLARLGEEASERAIAVASPTEQGLRLEAQRGGDLRAARVATPWRPSVTGLRDPAFEEAVKRAAEATHSSILHCEGVSGLPLASLLRMRESGLRLVLSIHDFALFCPRPQLLERDPSRFCNFCRDPGRCFACLADLGPPSLGFQEDRRHVAEELLAVADALIFPSPYLRSQHSALFPAGRADRGRIIPPALALPSPAMPRGGPLRHLAFVGALQTHKGAALIPEIARRIAAQGGNRPPRFSVFGGGDPDLASAIRSTPGVEMRGWYRGGSLTERLRREGVDLALLLSICPESHGLALDECLAAGVPVLAFAHGAIAERVESMACGALVPLESGAAGVAAKIADLAAGRATLDLRPERWMIGSPRSAAQAHLETYAQLSTRD